MLISPGGKSEFKMQIRCFHKNLSKLIVDMGLMEKDRVPQATLALNKFGLPFDKIRVPHKQIAS